MTLPKSYQWLNSLSPLPRMIQEALNLFGTLEKQGPRNNPTILAWANELGLSNSYSADEIPWCGLFAAIVAKRAGKSPVENPLWARNWARFGIKSPQASLGDVLVFARNGGGHVGLYVGEDSTTYHVLGGNQSDQVCFRRIQKSRCVAIRRPVYNVQPSTVKPYRLSIGGTVSSNEA